MAVFVRHGVFKTGKFLTQKNVLVTCYATKAEKKKGIDRKKSPSIDSSAQSLAAKGFLRPQKEYNPPSDINNKLQNIFENYLKSNDSNTKLDDINKKFAVLNECFKEFNHAVPNSLLHTMETLGDLKQFYNTPVDVKTPFDKLKQMELPPNVHIQYEYHRFHPDTDTKFGGLTAFPRSSTLVTGLKYKDKYKGHEQSTQWPYNS